MQNNPLSQFMVTRVVDLELFGLDVSITNASIFMMLVTLGLILFQYLAVSRGQVVPSRVQLVFEACYDFIYKMVDDSTHKKGRTYAPFIFSLFMFILCANFLGMFPGTFTVTSQIAVTFTIAIVLFTLITILGFKEHGTHFFRLFFPKGVPLALAPLIIPIELVAYLVRPITLSMRLFLNMTAGHIILKVFAGFSVMVGAFLGFLPALLNVVFIGFEFFVAGLQAFIFTLLICIYLNDALNMH